MIGNIRERTRDIDKKESPDGSPLPPHRALCWCSPSVAVCSEARLRPFLPPPSRPYPSFPDNPSAVTRIPLDVRPLFFVYRFFFFLHYFRLISRIPTMLFTMFFSLACTDLATLTGPSHPAFTHIYYRTRRLINTSFDELT